MSALTKQSAFWGKQKANPTETQSNLSIIRCPNCNAKFKEVGITIGTESLVPHTANFCATCKLAFPR